MPTSVWSFSSLRLNYMARPLKQRPATSFSLQLTLCIGAHLYRLTDIKTLELKAHNEGSIIHVPLKPFEDLGEEKEFNAPTENTTV